MKRHSSRREHAFIRENEYLCVRSDVMRSQGLTLFVAVVAVLSGAALFSPMAPRTGWWLHALFVASMLVLSWRVLGKIHSAGVRSISRAADDHIPDTRRRDEEDKND